MSDLLPVRFLRAYPPYAVGDMAALHRLTAHELIRLGIAAPIVSGQAQVETMEAMQAPEMAVTRRGPR